MSRTAHRFVSPSLRSATRVNLNSTTARSPCVMLTRRMMSSGSHAGHGGTSRDRQWIIGSALVFGPLFLYLVSPSARKGSHGHAVHESKSHRDEHGDRRVQHVESRREEGTKPIADDEGTEVSGQEVKESMERAFDADSPMAAQEQEGAVVKAGTTVEENSATEVQPQAVSSTDAEPIPEFEPNPASAPVAVDEATNVSSNENVQSTVSDAGEPAVEAKA